MQGKATERPWRTHAESVIGANGKSIGAFSGRETTLEIDIKNASLAVRAVNAHDAMREALLEAHRFIARLDAGEPNGPSEIYRLADKVRAALSLAGEGGA